MGAYGCTNSFAYQFFKEDTALRNYINQNLHNKLLINVSLGSVSGSPVEAGNTIDIRLGGFGLMINPWSIHSDKDISFLFKNNKIELLTTSIADLYYIYSFYNKKGAAIFVGSTSNCMGDCMCSSYIEVKKIEVYEIY
jgi:hypothetical protein